MVVTSSQHRILKVHCEESKASRFFSFIHQFYSLSDGLFQRMEFIQKFVKEYTCVFGWKAVLRLEINIIILPGSAGWNMRIVTQVEKVSISWIFSFIVRLVLVKWTYKLFTTFSVSTTEEKSNDWREGMLYKKSVSVESLVIFINENIKVW